MFLKFIPYLIYILSIICLQSCSQRTNLNSNNKPTTNIIPGNDAKPNDPNNQEQIDYIAIKKVVFMNPKTAFNEYYEFTGTNPISLMPNAFPVLDTQSNPLELESAPIFFSIKKEKLNSNVGLSPDNFKNEFEEFSINLIDYGVLEDPDNNFEFIPDLENSYSSNNDCSQLKFQIVSTVVKILNPNKSIAPNICSFTSSSGTTVINILLQFNYPLFAFTKQQNFNSSVYKTLIDNPDKTVNVNKVSNLIIDDFKPEEFFYFSGLNALTSLTLNSDNFKDNNSASYYNFIGLNNLSILDLSGLNFAQNENFSIIGLNNLTKINFANPFPSNFMFVISDINSQLNLLTKNQQNSLSSLTINNSIMKKIPDNAFQNLINLTKLNISNNFLLSSINSDVFNNLSKLSEVIINYNSSLTSIALDKVFTDVTLTTELPNTNALTTIGNNQLNDIEFGQNIYNYSTDNFLLISSNNKTIPSLIALNIIDKNNLLKIPNNYFDNVPNIISLSMSNLNSKILLADGLFYNLTKLAYLNLSTKNQENIVIGIPFLLSSSKKNDNLFYCPSNGYNNIPGGKLICTKGINDTCVQKGYSNPNQIATQQSGLNRFIELQGNTSCEKRGWPQDKY